MISKNVAKYLTIIQHKHVTLYKHAGEDLSELDSRIFANASPAQFERETSEKDKRRSNLLGELLRKETDYIEILKSTLNVYLPAAHSSAAPAALRYENNSDTWATAGLGKIILYPFLSVSFFLKKS